MTTFLKLMGVLLFAAGIAACVYFLGQGNLTGREQGLLSILLTTLSILYAASQVIAHPLPHGRGSAIDSEPRASASGLEPGAAINGAVYSNLGRITRVLDRSTRKGHWRGPGIPPI
jgi:hypothetical protein